MWDIFTAINNSDYLLLIITSVLELELDISNIRIIIYYRF